MQLVLHAPFGSRINKAWGLALRKRFCRQFNFELQAAATEDALMLSLGPQHSFPLADVFRYLHPETTSDVLVQAFLDAPVFKTRWRWNTTISLAVPRARGGRKVAPQIQRMLADDLMAAVFPDAAACLENIPGDRQIPDHPLVSQTVRDCLEEAMDFDGLRAVLGRIHRGELRLVARDTPEPSLFAHEILNAKPYAFLDDAPLEERRSHAVQSRRATDPGVGRRSWRARRGGHCAGARGGASGSPRRRRTARRAAHRGVPDAASELDGRTARSCSRGLAAARRAGSAVRSQRSAAGLRAESSSPSSGCRNCAQSIRTSSSPACRCSRRRRGWRSPGRAATRSRTAERPAHADRPGDGRGAGGSARHLARGGGRGAAAARSGRGRAARTLHAGRDRARMVRPDAPRPHPPLHAEPASRRNRAGQPGRFHALPVPLAARRDIVPADGPRRAARGRRRARRLRAGGGGVGAGGAAGAARSLRAVDARHDLPGRTKPDGHVFRLPSPPGSPAPASLVPATPIALFLREHAEALADAADCRRRSRRPARRRNSSCRCCGRAERRSSAILRRLRARCRPAAACDRRRWSPAGWRHRTDSPGCVRWCGRRADVRRRTIAAATSPAAGPQSRRGGEGADARRGGRAPGVVAAAPLRGRVPAAAHPRDERRDVARARARLPAARGARRDPQRPVRDRHVGRAVRAAGRRRTAARGPAHPGRRRPGHHQRCRSVEPDGNRHRRRADPDRRPQPGSSIATARLSPSSKETSCASWRRSTRASPPTCRAHSRHGAFRRSPSTEGELRFARTAGSRPGAGQEKP